MATILNRQVTFATNGTVTAAGLHNLIDDTEIYAGLISTQNQIASVGSSDMLLIADADGTSTSAPNRVTVGSMFNDALNNGIYTTGSFTNRVTAGSFVGALTGNVTGNITATTGTIATLNSTTGTISNLSATTSTFLGAITGSTNVINIGGGQIYKDTSGNFGIGTTSPTAQVTIGKIVDSATLPSTPANHSISLYPPTTTDYYGGGIGWSTGVNTAANICAVDDGGSGALSLVLSTGNNVTLTERLRIDSSGNLMIGKTSTTVAIAGVGAQASGFLTATRDSDQVLLVNRLTNDGTLVSLRQASTEEGNISVAGTTVSYNGGHLSRWSQLLNGQRDPAIKKGTVMSNLNEMCEWRDADGNLLQNEQLNKVKISDVEGDLNTAGAFVNWDNDDQDNPFDLNMAMTGDMIIRIAQGTIVNRGDLLMSAGDGTAKPQGDDIIRSKTIAKVTSTNVTCTYEDGSYCVPCVLMAC